MFQAVRKMARGKFCKAGEAIGDAFDGAEPGGTRADRGEERRQHGGGRFMAPVAEEAGETDTEDGAVEPGLFGRSSGNGGVVYSRQFTVHSDEKKQETGVDGSQVVWF